LSNRQQFPEGIQGGQPDGFPGGFPGGQPGGFPGGFPGGQPGGFPSGYPGGQPGAAPMSPAPQFIPPIPSSRFGVESMRWCLHRNTFVWMRSGTEFWFFPTFVSRRVIVGFRWRRRFGWVYHVIDPSNVLTFQCF
jgi:hypothetical protein